MRPSGRQNLGTRGQERLPALRAENPDGGSAIAAERLNDPAALARPPLRWWLHPRRLLACGLGLGLIPRAPGTCGTLLGVVLYLPMASLPLPVYLLSLVALAGFGVWTCGRTADELADHDPAAIVWDEVVGFLIAMTAAPAGWTWLVAGFVLFRFFDIVKPWPARAAERVPGGLGIMLDDLVAGALSLMVLQLAAVAVDASV